MVFGIENGHLDYMNGTINGTAYENAFRNLSPIFGSSFTNIVVGDPIHQKSDSYQWGFLASSTGQPDRISDGLPGSGPPTGDPPIDAFLQYTISGFTNSEPKVAFYGLLASYIADSYIADDFTRAALVSTNYGLAAVWMSPNLGVASSSSSHWQFHSAGLGDVLGTGMLTTINTGRGSSGDSLGLLSILGDATLRTSVIAPVQSLGGSTNGTTVNLSWTTGETGCQFYVYEAPNRGGPYTHVSGTWPTSNTSVSFTAQGSSTEFMVRAVKSVTTGSATYDNLSQGVFWP